MSRVEAGAKRKPAAAAAAAPAAAAAAAAASASNRGPAAKKRKTAEQSIEIIKPPRGAWMREKALRGYYSAMRAELAADEERLRGGKDDGFIADSAADIAWRRALVGNVDAAPLPRVSTAAPIRPRYGRSDADAIGLGGSRSTTELIDRIFFDNSVTYTRVPLIEIANVLGLQYRAVEFGVTEDAHDLALVCLRAALLAIPDVVERRTAAVFAFSAIIPKPVYAGYRSHHPVMVKKRLLALFDAGLTTDDVFVRVVHANNTRGSLCAVYTFADVLIQSFLLKELNPTAVTLDRVTLISNSVLCKASGRTSMRWIKFWLTARLLLIRTDDSAFDETESGEFLRLSIQRYIGVSDVTKDGRLDITQAIVTWAASPPLIDLIGPTHSGRSVRDLVNDQCWSRSIKPVGAVYSDWISDATEEQAKYVVALYVVLLCECDLGVRLGGEPTRNFALQYAALPDNNNDEAFHPVVAIARYAAPWNDNLRLRVSDAIFARLGTTRYAALLRFSDPTRNRALTHLVL